MRILVLEYHGVSFWSRSIRRVTGYHETHTAVMRVEDYALFDLSLAATGYPVLEAWKGHGVALAANASINHAAGTPVDVYQVACTLDHSAAWLVGLNHIGRPYDWASIWRWATGRQFQEQGNPKADFCSELAFIMLRAGSARVLRCLPHQVCPGMIPLSFDVTKIGSFKTVKAVPQHTPAQLRKLARVPRKPKPIQLREALDAC